MYEGSSTDISQQIMSAFCARTILHNWSSLPSHKCNRQVTDYSASVTIVLSLILTYFNYEITKDICGYTKPFCQQYYTSYVTI